MKKYLYSGMTLFIILAIIYLSLTSRSMGLSVTHMDKMQHALAYGVLAFFLTVSIRNWGILRRDLLISLVFCALLGGGLEIIQSRYGRMMEFGDFTADLMGALLGTVLARFNGRFSPGAIGRRKPDQGDSHKT